MIDRTSTMYDTRMKWIKMKYRNIFITFYLKKETKMIHRLIYDTRDTKGIDVNSAVVLIE